MFNFLLLSRPRGLSAGLAAVLAGALSLNLLSCKKDDGGSGVTPVAAAPNVKLVTSATLGTLLADSVGNTVYFFALDADGTNSCTSAACNPMWPVYYGGPITVPTGLKASDFTSKKTADGRAQTLYKGWPLYYFAPPANGVNTREAAGQTTGNGISGLWHVMNPGYGVVLARKAVLDQTMTTTTVKTYLTDDQGRTLYYFAKDDAFPNTKPTNCAGACGSVWPALYLSAPTLPSTLKASDFSTITRDQSTTTGPYGTTTTSTQQLAYKGRPLYYFASDNATRGKITGDHFSSYGDYWYVAAL